MVKKRKVRFRDFDEVIREAESLMESGYTEAGEWTLGEVCDHLEKTIKAQCGMPSRLPTFMQIGGAFMAGTFMQATRGRQVPTMWPPKKDISDEDGLKRLKKSIKRFTRASKNTGFLMFRNKTPKMVKKFHLRHCQHHFEFLVGRSSRKPKEQRLSNTSSQ